MTTFRLQHLDSDQDYEAAFPVMRELRPQLTDAIAFARQVRRQAEQGYRILAALRGEQVAALAGYRVQENFICGRFLYVDDLVTTADARQHGLGAMLIDALREEARQQRCANLVLDTGLANALAQRFYFRQGLLAFGMHFRQKL
ncbi:GNAT family N-acetyltransferase [Burkholderia dolosa]|uniref:GNAT family N-acetyltransferase n=1 Tax=Burkholderia dolosa TaxID=152500 RepID=UPI001B9C9EC0|nr:GNAT family N-acetyltransferase [Burkholderia dolosa]MBR8460437.1 GNAT family N-acetyltransferase [Burkholderia dolosa]MDN7421677.1 GNAT family N-acetyltransferase [Burkholderia dolosa]